MTKKKNKQKMSGFREQRQKAGVKKKLQGLKIINISIIILVFLFAIAYVVIVNDLSIRGFVLRDIKLQVKDLKDENEQLAIEVMKMEGYDNIEKRAQELQLVKVDKIDYITITDTSMAKK